MDFLTLFAYCLPILLLIALIRNTGKKAVLFLVWGCIAAILAAFLLHLIFPVFQEIVFQEITISPVIEELFKAFPLLFLARAQDKTSNRDILACSLASGIGFSLVETGLLLNPGLLGLSPASGTTHVYGFFDVLTRSFSTTLMHGCTTGLIGLGIVLFRGFDRKALPALLLGFYTIAVTIHAFYNLNYYYFGLAGLIADFLIPIFLFVFLLECYSENISHFLEKENTKGP